MRTFYVHINKCYGGACCLLKREYNSQEDFLADLEKVKAKKRNEVGIHPLDFSNPTLLKVSLADNEGYKIVEYDGYESLEFHKLKKINSSYEEVYRHRRE